VLEHLDVLGHRLLGDGEGFGEVVDRRVGSGEARDDRPPDRIGQRHEGLVERVVVVVVVMVLFDCSATSWFINQLIDYTITALARAVNPLV
jgi:hypothetical protein